MNIKVIGLSFALLCPACTATDVQTGVQVATTSAKVVCTGLGFWDAAGRPAPDAAVAAGLEALSLLCSANPSPDTLVPVSLLATAKALVAKL